MKRKWVTGYTMPSQGENERNLWVLQKRGKLRLFSCRTLLHFVNWWNAVSAIQLCMRCPFNYPSKAVGSHHRSCVEMSWDRNGVKKLQFIICLVLAKAGLNFACNSHYLLVWLQVLQVKKSHIVQYLSCWTRTEIYRRIVFVELSVSFPKHPCQGTKTLQVRI